MIMFNYNQWIVKISEHMNYTSDKRCCFVMSCSRSLSAAAVRVGLNRSSQIKTKENWCTSKHVHSHIKRMNF